jgi:hypothetical protein
MTTEVESAQAKADQGDAAKKQTMADILAKKRPNTRTIDIIVDSDLAGEIRLKEAELEQAQAKKKRGKGSLADGMSQIEQALDEMYERAAEGVVTFTFQDIGRKSFDDLVMAHKPTPEQKKHVADLGGGILEYNTDTFPPALISAAAIDPEISLDEAETIFDQWGSADAEILFTTALLVCKERTSVPLSKNGSEPTLASD